MVFDFRIGVLGEVAVVVVGWGGTVQASARLAVTRKTKDDPVLMLKFEKMTKSNQRYCRPAGRSLSQQNMMR
jgi:hypothetical protein